MTRMVKRPSGNLPMMIVERMEVVPSLPALDIRSDQRLFDRVNFDEGPFFKTQEVASCFFQRSAAWLRLQSTKGWFVPRGGSNGDKINPRRDTQARLFTLADIENLAHALHSNDRIDATQLQNTLYILMFIGRGYGAIS